MIDMLMDPFMQRALIVAGVVGLTGPVIGTYLVQRRMSLLGDGIGHVALAGVAAGWLAGSAANLADRSAWAVPGAIVFATIGALTIENIRSRGKVAADVIMAILFYGGIAGGVLLMGLAGGTGANLLGYLFGSISTVSSADVTVTVALGLAVLIVGLGLRPALFSVSHDNEFARTSGIPVHLLNVAVAIGAALTITVAMRVVGLLLVSGLMIVPVAIAQLFAKSFASTMNIAMGIGALVCLTGLSLTYFYDMQPGALIIVLAIGLYAFAGLVRTLGTLVTR
ncbi:MAG: ABC transporter [Actinobacteria bacterium HGW-Actinobacteria-4]|nr:MAG: ABC transporter [Actinobacteria bacterium HGW-Actinobacteria-4]